MAFYGLVSAGAPITASENADSVSFLDSTTARVSAATVLGLGGNDFIYLGARGYTAAASAAASASGSADLSPTVAVSASLIGSGTYNTGTSLASADTATVAITGIITSQRAARNVVGTQLYGNEGNDRIFLGGQVGVITSTTIGGGAGNDLIANYNFVNGATASANNTVNGLDTTAFTANNLFVEMGGGNDTVRFEFTTGYLGDTTINGNLGKDVVTISATGSSTFGSGAAVQLGGDSDTFTAWYSQGFNSTVVGGGGADTINIGFSANSTGLSLEGDVYGTNTEFDGADQILVSSTGAIYNSTLNGAGGNDTITFNVTANFANITGGNIFQLNAGDDFFSAYGVAKDTIQAGGGNDSISITTGALSTLMNMGGGNDTLTLVTTANTASIASGTTVYGGLGADVFSAAVNADDSTVRLTFGYTSYGDSTLDTMDTIAFGTTATTSDYIFRYDAGGLSLGSFDTGNQSATNGFVTFTAATDGAVTARAAIVDGSMTTEGAVASFLDGDGQAYFFIQGGATDLITQVGSADQTASATLTLAGGNTVTLDFGNN